jgi:hypothetical protein
MLAFILHLFIGSTFAGTAVIGALVTGNDAPTTILAAAAVGYIVATPVTLLVARHLRAIS